VSDANCTNNTNQSATVTVFTPPSVTTQPASQTDCKGNDVEFSAAYSAVGTINYKWQSSPDGITWTDIGTWPNITGASGTTSSSPVILNVGNVGVGGSNGINTNGTRYRIIITDANGCSVTSNAALLTVNDITDISPNNTTTTICEGGSFSFTVSTSGNNPSSYQWKKDGVNLTDGTVNGVTINGATTATLTVSNASVSQSTSTATGYQVTVVFPITIPNNNPGNPSTCTQTSSLQRKVVVNPKPNVTTSSTAIICTNSATNISLTADITSTFTWTIGTVTGGITGASGGSGNIIGQTLINSGTTAGTVQYIITPTASATLCVGNPYTITVTVNPKPAGSATSQAICSNTSANVTLNSTVAGTTFTWTASLITIPAGGTVTGFSNCAGSCGSSISQVLVNTGTSNGVVRYSVTPVANNCAGNTFTVDVTVYPVATVTAIANKIYCPNITTPVITLSGPVSGTSFTWTNDNTATGLAASGTGDIPSFTTTNNTTSAILSTITITPSANGCTGTPITFTITINTIPVVVTDPQVVTACANSTVSFTSSATGVPSPTVQWQVSTNNGGSWAAATGTVSTSTNAGVTTTSISFTAANTDHGKLFRVIFTNSCGSDTSASALLNVGKGVNIPSGNQPKDQVACGASGSITFTSKITGGAGLIGTLTAQWQYSTDGGTTWINVPNTVTSSNNGNIDMSLTILASDYPLGTRFRVEASNNGCLTTSNSATFSINPIPSVNQPADETLCAGLLTTAVNFSGTGTSYTWTNNNVNTGLAASGTGNIPSFTALNNTGSTITSTIIVTPVYTAGGVSCMGQVQTFSINVYPKPIPVISHN
jgi:hypothetical protein